MWPFNKKTIKNKTAVLVRYTRNAAQTLFPKITPDEWDEHNCPNNVVQFVEQSVSRMLLPDRKNVQNATIATIDHKYIDWLATVHKTHSTETLAEYINNHIHCNEFWDDRLIESGMTQSINTLGVTTTIMPSKSYQQDTNYVIDKNGAITIAEILSSAYGSQDIFVPGWILKESDAPMCKREMPLLSELFWREGVRVRLGKFLEQTYDSAELLNKFTLIPLFVPFSIKTTVSSASFVLHDNVGVKQVDAMDPNLLLRLQDSDRLRLFEVLAQHIPNLVSVGADVITPARARYTHCCNVAKNNINNVRHRTY